LARRGEQPPAQLIDAAAPVRSQSSWRAFLRAQAALLRNGQPCNRSVVEGSEFCVDHTKLLASVDAETMRQGRTPTKRARREPVLREFSEPASEQLAAPATTVAEAEPGF
jgi:hypothetical protein